MALLAVERELAELKAEVVSCTEKRDAVLKDMESNTLILETKRTNRVHWNNPRTYVKANVQSTEATMYSPPEFESDDHRVAHSLVSTYSMRQMRLTMAKESLATFQGKLRTLAGVPGHSRVTETSSSIPAMLKMHTVKTPTLGVYFATGSNWVFGPSDALCHVNHHEVDTLCQILLGTHSPEELNEMVGTYAGNPARLPELDKKASRDLENVYRKHDPTAKQRAVKTALEKLERIGEETVEIDTGALLEVMGGSEQGTTFLTKFVKCLNFIMRVQDDEDATKERIELKAGDKRTRDKTPQLVMYQMEEFEQNSVKHLIEQIVCHGGTSTSKWMRRCHFVDAGVDMNCYDNTWDSFYPVTVPTFEDEDDSSNPEDIISELREWIPLPPCGHASIAMYRKVEEACTKAHESKRTRLE